MARNSALADAAARAAAIDPARSCIVQAPAGSGKTGLLVQRYLALLAKVETPEEIVAITFTRKAAAEMRGRILAALAPRTGGGDYARETQRLAQAAAAQDERHGWRLAQHPNRLRVLTIDAFGMTLARQLPWLSRLGGAVAPVDDAAPLYRMAARTTLAAIDRDASATSPVARLLRHLDNQAERTEELLAGMLARRDQWLRHVGGRDPAALRHALEAALLEIVTDALRGLATALAPIGSEIVGLAAYAGRNVRMANPALPVAACAELSALPPPEESALPSWRGIAELLLTKEGSWRKAGGVNVKIGFPPGPGEPKAMKERMGELLDAHAENDALAAQLDAVRRLPATRYSDEQWDVMLALLALLPEAVAALRGEFRGAGATDFIEIAMAAQAAAAQTAGEAPRHLLIDEFQDTSTSQSALVQRLTQGWAPGDGRTLFLVGDPMQSIYRFREAEVGLFLAAREGHMGGVALDPLALQTNFRSQGGIVEWVNRVFAQILPARGDVLTGAVPFSAAVAQRDPEQGAAVTLYHQLADDADPHGAQAEAAEIARIAQEALAAPSGSATRESPPVAILVRARSHLGAILPALRRAGVPYQAVDIDPLGEQPVVLDLLSLTRALLYPADRIAWLAVLRAPWCGLTLADLLALCGDAKDAPIEACIADGTRRATLSPDGRQRLERTWAVLSGAIGHRGRRGLRAWVAGAWLALGGPACVDAEALQHAEAYLGVLDELEADGAEPAPEELARRLESLRAQPDPAPGPAVQVMTIHKAKGLEFGTVILPGLARRSGRPESPLLRWLERPGGGERGLLMAPIHETGSERDATYDYLKEIEAQREAHEMRRLLYVATTRARDRLHLFGALAHTPDGPNAPGANTLLGALWPAIETEFLETPVTPRGGVATRAVGAPQPGHAGPPIAFPVAPALTRLPADWALPELPAPLASVAVAPEQQVRTSVEYSWAGFAARQVGTVVHRQLLRITREGPAAWPEARLRALQPGVRAALAQLGVAEAELDAGAARAVGALVAALADERGRWVLAPRPDGRAEYDVTAVEHGRTRRMRVDRTFVESGVRWIVDYKTGTHEGGDLGVFLEQEVKRYRESMTGYARALHALQPGPPIRLALYFPLIPGGWKEWEFVP